MTPAHRRRLERRGTELLQAALAELDPRCFPGAGKAPAELTKQERGDKFWHLKATRAQLALVSDIEQLLGLERGAFAAARDELPNPTPAEIDQMIAAAERDYQRIVGKPPGNDDEAGP